MFRSSVFAIVLAGCSPAKSPQLPAYCVDDGLFTAALLRCVDKSPSRAESRACRKAVHESCGIVETVSVAAHE